MLVDSDLALGTLQTLADLQGRDVDPLTEEEPGRILHEMRFGESARLSLGGSSVYYGSIDATPLFVMLLGELQRWGNRRDEVDALLPAADRALAWIDEFGDRDGDGYVEYRRTSDRGLQNQGWKDSWDGVHFADGRIAAGARSRCARSRGTCTPRSAPARTSPRRRATSSSRARLRARAADLKLRFNRDFWLERVRVVRDGSRPRQAPDRLAGLEHGPLPVDRNRRRREGADRRQAAAVTGPVLRLGDPHARELHDRATTRSATTTAACGPTTTRCARPDLARYGLLDEAHE